MALVALTALVSYMVGSADSFARGRTVGLVQGYAAGINEAVRSRRG